MKTELVIMKNVKSYQKIQIMPYSKSVQPGIVLTWFNEIDENNI